MSKAAGVDRPRACGRTWVLDEQNFATALRVHIVFEMRVGQIDHIAGVQSLVAEPALKHVPQLVL